MTLIAYWIGFARCSEYSTGTSRPIVTMRLMACYSQRRA